MNVHSGKKNVVTCHEKDIVVGRANVTHLGINSSEIQTKKIYIRKRTRMDLFSN